MECGIGVQERRRFKVKDRVGAGKKCGALREMRACYGSFCDQNEIHGNSKYTVYLMFTFYDCKLHLNLSSVDLAYLRRR